MKKIETTCGYREEYENGEIRYYSAWSGQGYVYKDDEAFKTGNGVAYIREAEFEHAREDYGKDYVTPEQIEKEGYGMHTKAEIISEARDYFRDEIPEGYPFTEDFLAFVAQVCYDIADWQGIDILLDELNWDEPQEEGAKPYPWNWAPAM